MAIGQVSIRQVPADGSPREADHGLRRDHGLGEAEAPRRPTEMLRWVIMIHKYS